MLLAAFLRWWYTKGWITLARYWQNKLRDLAKTFSVGLLLRTLFQPWKRIVTQTGPNTSPKQWFAKLLDNLVSRVVGFWVRIFTLIAAGISLLIGVILAGATLVAWPLSPWALIWLVIKGVRLL